MDCMQRHRIIAQVEHYSECFAGLIELDAVPLSRGSALDTLASLALKNAKGVSYND